MPNFMHKLCSNAIKEMLGLHFFEAGYPLTSVEDIGSNPPATSKHQYVYISSISIYIFFIAHTLLITRLLVPKKICIFAIFF